MQLSCIWKSERITITHIQRLYLWKISKTQRTRSYQINIMHDTHYVSQVWSLSASWRKQFFVFFYHILQGNKCTQIYNVESTYLTLAFGNKPFKCWRFSLFTKILANNNSLRVGVWNIRRFNAILRQHNFHLKLSFALYIQLQNLEIT
jgi:hypothetical protein